MTKEALTKAVQREPFQPFTLDLADGRDVRVPHREFISMHPTGRTVVVYGQNEDLDILDMMLVTGIRIGARNGHRKQ